MKANDGKWYSPGALGYSLSMVPAVALSDLMHRFYQVPPPEHFPLESDWSLLFFASFTNAFVTATLGIIILLYGQALGWPKKHAVIVSLVTIFTTNLFPASKFSFAQPLFTCFTILCFYLIKRYSLTSRIRYLLFAGLAFVAVVFSYNVAYYLPIIPFLVYLFLLLKPARRWQIARWLIPLFALAIIWKWKTLVGLLPMLHVKPKALFEGTWGYLFSPGKSLFLYSPILVLILIFWQKLTRRYWPEIASFLLLAFMFIFFYGPADLFGGIKGYHLIWYGGMTWGPRYLVPLLPFLGLLVGMVLLKLNTLQRYLVFYPLLLGSLAVQLVGVSVPYLLQYRDLPYSIFINQDEISAYEYASFIPRYSPLSTMLKELRVKLKTLPQTLNHGIYDARFYDGFDLPLYTGNGIIRGWRQEGHISFRNLPTNAQLTLQLNNVPDASDGAEIANVEVKSNQQQLAKLKLVPHNQASLDITTSKLISQGDKSYLDLFVSYTATPSSPHVIYIEKLAINDIPVNLGSIDYPDASSLGQKTTTEPYRFYGNKQKDPWALWYMRAGVNERTLDFWWMKNFYYWDRPQKLIWGLFAIDVVVLGVSILMLRK